MFDKESIVETLLTSQLSREDALAIGKLLVTIWPKDGVSVEDRADKLQTDRGNVDGHVLSSRSFIIRDSDRVIAHSAVFVRTIRTSAGELQVAALAQVCSDAKHRGKKLGLLVTRAVLALVDEGLVPFSLFQTSKEVKPFYERLGCRAIDNKIVNSLTDDPTKCPFWDGVTMIYPASRDDWPTGEIDLLGPGY